MLGVAFVDWYIQLELSVGLLVGSYGGGLLGPHPRVSKGAIVLCSMVTTHSVTVGCTGTLLYPVASYDWDGIKFADHIH